MVLFTLVIVVRGGDLGLLCRQLWCLLDASSWRACQLRART
jgi:hypothetical protein